MMSCPLREERFESWRAMSSSGGNGGGSSRWTGFATRLRASGINDVVAVVTGILLTFAALATLIGVVAKWVVDANIGQYKMMVDANKQKISELEKDILDTDNELQKIIATIRKPPPPQYDKDLYGKEGSH